MAPSRSRQEGERPREAGGAVGLLLLQRPSQSRARADAAVPASSTATGPAGPRGSQERAPAGDRAALGEAETGLERPQARVKPVRPCSKCLPEAKQILSKRRRCHPQFPQLCQRNVWLSAGPSQETGPRERGQKQAQRTQALDCSESGLQTAD